MVHKLLGRIFLLCFCFLLAGPVSQAQSLPDFANINVNELTDSEVRILLQQARSLGYSQQDLIELAQTQGLSVADISKFSERLANLGSSRTAKAEESPSLERTRQYQDTLMIPDPADNALLSEVFGIDFFRNRNIKSGFQPNLNIPTPKDYKLGSGDEVFIDLYGNSEQYYQAVINPDGNVVLENIGPIHLAGLTIETAQSRIKTRFSRLYQGLTGSSPNTFLSVSLGSIRSINVSVVGEVTTPGNYSMSAFSTIFNALYIVGGIKESGSLRAIKLFRGGKLISTLDAYDYLLNADISKNLRLENDDVVLIEPYTSRIRIEGAVKRPALYELTAEETFADLLKYAGGFDENAFTDQVSVVRNSNGEKVVADVFESQFEVFSPRAGDLYTVNRVLNRYANRVQIQGAVFRPGNYALTEGLTISQLIDKADGLQGDASLERGQILRTKSDLRLETISFNLTQIRNGQAQDIVLQREDIIRIFSINELVQERYVEITGEVNDGGVFSYSENMTLEDLIVLAGGFKASASQEKVEITRRLGNADLGNVSEVLMADVSTGLAAGQNQESFRLQAFDHVVVRRNPDFFIQQFVAIEGQVKFPGDYAIKNQTERVSSLLERAGGINQYAYVEGATLLRKTEFYNEKSDLERRVDDLENLMKRFESGDSDLSEAQRSQLIRISEELAILGAKNSENQNLSSFAKRERLREIVQRNTLTGDVELNESEAIGIDLKKILANPGSKHDLILEEGDVLVIPKQAETVRLRGRVLYPTTVLFEDNRSLKHFIHRAGGFDIRAKRRGTYVIYANGSVARTRQFLFFRSYPKIAPGAEIIVPAKPAKLPISVQEILGITSGLATLALLASQINF